MMTAANNCKWQNGDGYSNDGKDCYHNKLTIMVTAMNSSDCSAL